MPSTHAVNLSLALSVLTGVHKLMGSAGLEPFRHPVATKLGRRCRNPVISAHVALTLTTRPNPKCFVNGRSHLVTTRSEIEQGLMPS